mgnify:CR=1 FL=1
MVQKLNTKYISSYLYTRMSTGGIFQLITNDGKQDKMLTAVTLLNKRLMDIEQLRRKDPQIKDPTPTIVDVERTHVFFLAAHFKPFVALGYEYQISTPDSGVPRFGGEVTFSIPQFGDFFHDMAIHVVLEGLKPLDVVKRLADPPGSPTNTGLPKVQDQVRYCDYPGERLLSKVSFDVNHNPLDSYGSDDYVLYRLFNVLPNKQSGWNRNVGQQDIWTGSLYHNPGSENFSEVKYFTSGAQTWKDEQERLEMWIPLLFWFNLDPSLSIPSVAIPYGQRYVTARIATVDQICQGKTYSMGTGRFIAPEFTRFELVINNIFVNPEIHDIFIKRVGFTMIRVHLNQNTIVDQSSNSILMNKLKWPIETMYVGLRPIVNDTSLQDWHLFSNIQHKSKTIPVAYPPIVAGVPSMGFSNATWSECSPTIDRFSVVAHDIPLYTDLPSGFYNSYLPWAKGYTNVQTPNDCGALMIPFNLYPGVYQPSGHVNVSRAREMYFNFTCPTITSSNRATLVCMALAINFLLVSDGSAVLRYST